MLIPIVGIAQNPLIQTHFTPDPAPMVYDGVVYLYSGNDEDNADYFTMNDWRVYSSTDMVNWTDHGAPLNVSDFKWSVENTAWAAQCIERNGKFYWYVSCEFPGHWHVVGVAVSDSPTGPFEDAIGEPLIVTGEMGDIDPTVFIDDDGQAYLYWGNRKLSYILLNEDMISYDKDLGIVDLIPYGTYDEGKEVPQHIIDGFGPKFEEAPWVYKRGDLYYNIYAAGGVPEDLSYSTAPTATGPWTYRGIFMPVTDANQAFTNHPGIIDYKDNSYLFYHTGRLPGGGGFNRSTCVEQFTYNEDGTIPQIVITDEGPDPVGTINPYEIVQAETIAWSEGLKTKESDKVGVYVTNIDNNDYIRVRNVDFENNGAASFIANVASDLNGGIIEIRVDEIDGDIIGELNVSYTGGWDEWITKTTKVENVKGVRDIYFVFKGDPVQEQLFNFDNWKFTPKKMKKELVGLNAITDKFKIDIEDGVNSINYIVKAVYSDGSEEDITNLVDVNIVDKSIVTAKNGLIKAIDFGETDIIVSYENKADIIKLVVKELISEVTIKKISVDIDNVNNIQMLRGTSLPFVVLAEYMDGNIVDVTKAISYDISHNEVAQVRDYEIVALSDGYTSIKLSIKDELGNNFSFNLKVNVETFPLYVDKGFDASIWDEGSLDEASKTIITGQYGFAGWYYDKGIDLSNYNYLIVELSEKQTCGASLRIYDENNYWSEPAMYDFDDRLKVAVDLSNMTKTIDEVGIKCIPEHIYYVGFWSFGGSPIKINRIFLSNDGITPVENATFISTISYDNNIVDVYTIMGIKIREKVDKLAVINELPNGLYIIGNEKIFIRK